MAGPVGMRSISCLCKVWRLTVRWLVISRGGREFTLSRVWYRDALSHIISGASGVFQFQVAVLSERRVYAEAGDK